MHRATAFETIFLQKKFVDKNNQLTSLTDQLIFFISSYMQQFKNFILLLPTAIFHTAVDRHHSVNSQLINHVPVSYYQMLKCFNYWSLNIL